MKWEYTYRTMMLKELQAQLGLLGSEGWEAWYLDIPPQGASAALYDERYVTAYLKRQYHLVGGDLHDFSD